MSREPEIEGEDAEIRRVRFYGISDLATGWQTPRVLEIASAFDPKRLPIAIVDVLELHNVHQYLALGLLPPSLPEQERKRLIAMAPQIGGAIARFFASIDDSNVAAVVTGVDHEYHGDLLELLGRGKVFERCAGKIMLRALEANGVHLGTMLSNSNFVRAYDTDVRAELLASPTHAEHLVRRHLEKDRRRAIHLPRSLSPADARGLIERYIDSDEANLNYVRLISRARDQSEIGVDPKLRLRAKRRSNELNAKLFEDNEGIKTGFEVSIDESQEEPASETVDRSDGMVWRYTYSRTWLEATLDNASVLNNFQHLFGFADSQALLTLPSYKAALGVMEGVFGLTGNDEYKTGHAFQATDSTSWLQTTMYRNFLKQNDVDLEQVLSWFCSTYLVEEFGIANFTFNPSVGDTSYLQRVRHLFAEMESLAHQFSLYAEDGELDRDLLSIGSDQVRYKDIPSRLDGKYVYSSGTPEIEGILRVLFSDQSTLTYIDENLRGRSAAHLLLEKRPGYDDFHDYQKSTLDQLIQMEILEHTRGRVRFSSTEQLRILKSLFDTEATSYYRLSVAGRTEVDAMVARGWVVRQSTLLTRAEGSYFNFFLNRVDFSNGPNLRNAYLHGSQPAADADRSHSKAYIIALRLCVALAIKINDDVCLHHQEKGSTVL